VEGDVAHQPLLGSRKLEGVPFIPFIWYKNIQTDGQNYDSQDRASIAASGGKNQNNDKCAYYSQGGTEKPGAWPSRGAKYFTMQCNDLLNDGGIFNGNFTNLMSSLTVKEFQKSAIFR